MMKRILEKWKPILEILDISESHYEIIAKFSDDFAKQETKEYCTLGGPLLPVNPSELKAQTGLDALSENLLPLNLRILSKLDLDKVKFSDICNSENEVSTSISFGKEDAWDLLNGFGIDILANIESVIAEQVVQTMNTIIEKNGSITIHKPIYSIVMITGKDFGPKIIVKSYFK